MNTVTHWIIVGCAFVAAVILTAFGYRRLQKTSPDLPDFSKRCSLFAVALCCFIALLSTNARGDQKQQIETATPPTASITDKKLPAAITSPKNWQQFRKLWWDLVGKYEKAKNGSSPRMGSELSINISNKQRAEYSAQLCKLLGVRDIPHLQASIAATTNTLGGVPWNENSDAVRFSIPMLVLGKSSLDLLNNFQQRYAHMMTRMMMPSSAMLKGPAVEKMLIRLVALKQLRRDGKLDTKAYRDALDICSRDMWRKIFLVVGDFWQAPILLNSEGEIVIIGTCTRWNESASNKMPKLESGEKLFPPISKQETKLADELRALMKHPPSEKRTAAIKKLETKVYDLPSAWLRGLNLQILDQRREVEKNSSQQQSQASDTHKLRRLKKLETQFEAMCKIYKARQAVEKFLTKNLGPADGTVDASVKKMGEK